MKPPPKRLENQLRDSAATESAVAAAKTGTPEQAAWLSVSILEHSRHLPPAR